MENRKPIWKTVLGIIIVIAIIVVAYVVAVNTVIPPDLSLQEGEIEAFTIQAFVGEVNYENRSFEVWWVDEGETDSGLTYSEEHNLLVRWEDGVEINPHHPSILQGGEEVIIVPTQVWGENTEEIYIDTLEIISGLRG